MPATSDPILAFAVQIVAAHVGNNTVSTDQVSGLITNVHHALATAGKNAEPPPAAEPKVPVKKSVFADHIVCLDCGHSFKMLRRHVLTDHAMTVDQYRDKWGLPRDYPVVAPEYAERRSALAKKSGLGTRGQGHAPARRGRPPKQR
jgi:predicted transcriptional regulator